MITGPTSSASSSQPANSGTSAHPDKSSQEPDKITKIVIRELTAAEKEIERTRYVNKMVRKEMGNVTQKDAEDWYDNFS